MVENIYIDESSNTFAGLRESIIELYSKIFEYQARLASYLGKNTLRRFGINVLELGGWTELSSTIETLDQNCQKHMKLYDVQFQQHQNESLISLFEEQARRLDNIRQEIDKHGDYDSQSDKILSWVSKVDPFDDHQEVREKLGDNHFASGQWLFTNRVYGDWNGASDGTLTMYGSIGTGKSSLVSILIEQLLDGSPSCVAFYYCTRSPASVDVEQLSNATVRIIVQSVLRQLAIARDGRTVSATIVERYERRTQNSRRTFRPSMLDLVDTLVDIIDETPSTIIVIDALDECLHSKELLDFFAKILERTRKLRLFLSTRPHFRVHQHLTKSTSMEITDHTDQDIYQYIKSELLQPLSRTVRKVPSQIQAQRLCRILHEQAAGM